MIKFLLFSLLSFLRAAQLSSPLANFPAYQDVFSEFQKYYPAIELKIDYTGDLASASADWLNGKKAVIVNRGLLLTPRLTADALRMVLCHEVGHWLAGPPRKNVPAEWMGPVAEDSFSHFSSEGQADFFAARSCFPKMVLGQSHSELFATQKSDRIKRLCTEAWKKNSPNYFLCLRSAVASFQFLNLNFSFPISFDTPDTAVSSVLVRDTYPDRQCRLDTFVAGALRTAPRPSCWYR